MGPQASCCRFQPTMTPIVARLELSTNDDEMDTEEPCTTPSERATTIVGLEICVQKPTA